MLDTYPNMLKQMVINGVLHLLGRIYWGISPSITHLCGFAKRGWFPTFWVATSGSIFRKQEVGLGRGGCGGI